MQETIFSLKHFQVAHGNSTMKVGTDAMLLGSWTPINGIATALEVGCGCGIISLMLAQRNPNTRITAIDIDEGSVLEASRNFEGSLWKDNLFARKMSLKEMASSGQQFDLIIANLPYFQNSLPSINARRNLARHAPELNPELFFYFASFLSHQNSIVALVLPHKYFTIWNEQAKLNGFSISRRCEVLPSTGKSPVLNLSVWSKNNIPFQKEEITIRHRGDYTQQYQNLLKDFLTIF